MEIRKSIIGCIREAAQGWGSDVGGDIRQRPPLHRMYSIREAAQEIGDEVRGEIQ
jgi:hypothetical protein